VESGAVIVVRFRGVIFQGGRGVFSNSLPQGKRMRGGKKTKQLSQKTVRYKEKKRSLRRVGAVRLTEGEERGRSKREGKVNIGGGTGKKRK